MYELLQRYGLWAVFFGTMLEGDLTLLLAGVLARGGLFGFDQGLIVATAGGFVGDSLSYFIGGRVCGPVKRFYFFNFAPPRSQKLMPRLCVLSVFVVQVWVWP